MYNRKNLVSDFIKKLNNYWAYLQKRYDNYSELKITNSTEYAECVLRSRNNKFSSTINEIIDILRDDMIDDSTKLISSIIQYDVDENNTETISTIVVIEERSLLHTIIEHLSNIDKLYDYCKILLRHEMGHILKINELINAAILFRISSINFGKVISEQMRDYYNDFDNIQDLSGDEYIEKYYNIPLNKSANIRVGLSYKDFQKANKFLIDEDN